MTRPIPRFAIVLIALCAYLTCATAQNASKTWRCGNSYSDQPCPDGKAVNADDPRNAADRRAAEAATRRERVNADLLERDRLRQEASARRQSQVTVIGRDPQAAPPRSEKPAVRKKKGRKEPEYFTAADPRAALDKPKKKGAP